MKTHYKILYIGVLILTAVFTIVPLYLIIFGTYKWHVAQPEFIQGGMELLVFGVIMLLALKKFPVKKSICIVFISAIYLSMNGVILPFLIDYLYFEILIYVGTVINSLKKEIMHSDIGENFITGVAVWGTGAVLCSLIGIGSINALRIYTLVLLVLCVYFSKGKKYENLYLKFSRITEKQNKDFFSLVIFILFCLIILLLFAKTNTAQDYDSLWYGLRPEHVLVGENSFYDYLGYGAYIYYYPKLMELLYLPISNLGDYSFLQGANIFVYLFVILEIIQIMKRIFNSKVKQEFIMPFTLLIASIPVIANMAATAKPDIFGLFFGLMTIRQFYDYLKTKSTQSFIMAFCSCILSTGTKLTYVLWCGIAFVVMLVFLIIEKIKSGKIINFPVTLSNRITVFSTCVCIAGIHYRTFKLTGFPLYPFMTTVMSKIGFKARYFADSSNTGASSTPINIKLVLERLYSFIFDPKALPHVIIAWTSSFVFFLFILYLFRNRKSQKKFSVAAKYLLILMIAYSIVMLYYMFRLSMPDGNYFMLPLSFIIIYLLNSVISDREDSIYGRKLIRSCILMFLVLHLPVMFVSHTSWAYGTKAFSKDIIVNNFETKSKSSSYFEYYGVTQIAEYLSEYENCPKDRFISSSDVSGFHFRFPCAVEGAAELENTYLSGTAIMGTYKDFVSYVNTIDVKGFIVLNDDTSNYAQYVRQYISENTIIKTINDRSGAYYERR